MKIVVLKNRPGMCSDKCDGFRTKVIGDSIACRCVVFDKSLGWWPNCKRCKECMEAQQAGEAHHDA